MSTNSFPPPATSYWAPPSGGQPVPMNGDQQPSDGGGRPQDGPNQRPAHIGRLIGLFVALLVVTGVGAALLGYRQGVAAGEAGLRPELQAAQAERDDAAADLADLQRQEAARRAQAAESPDLRAVAADHFDDSFWVTGDAEFLEITVTDTNAAEIGPKLADLLAELGFSPAVLERMSKTRALDGTQTAEGHNCNVSWTYHPDDGLQLVFEAAPAG